jgi:hypothetical protein
MSRAARGDAADPGFTDMGRHEWTRWAGERAKQPAMGTLAHGGELTFRDAFLQALHSLLWGQG